MRDTEYYYEKQIDLLEAALDKGSMLIALLDRENRRKDKIIELLKKKDKLTKMLDIQEKTEELFVINDN